MRAFLCSLCIMNASYFNCYFLPLCCELRNLAGVQLLVPFLTGSIASTVAMELPGCRVAELTPCTGVDAHLIPYCIPTASAPCACREHGLSRERLNSFTPRGSLNRNSNFCTNIKEKRKRLAVTWPKLCTEIQHKYHRKNDLTKYDNVINIQAGLTKGRSFSSAFIPVCRRLVWFLFLLTKNIFMVGHWISIKQSSTWQLVQLEVSTTTLRWQGFT